jgi:hypothetical protein
MSVKQISSPLKLVTETPRVDAQAEAAEACPSGFDKLPNEILDLIFSFVPKKACRAVTLVDKRFNQVMANNYANRAIFSLNYGFHVTIPKFHQKLAEEGTSMILDVDVSLHCKLMVMEKNDHESLKAIYHFALEQLHAFKKEPSIVKGLARVDQATCHKLPPLKLHPLSVTVQNEGIPWEVWAANLDFVSLPVLLKNVNMASFMTEF